METKIYSPEKIIFCDPENEGCGCVELIEKCPWKGYRVVPIYRACPNCEANLNETGTWIAENNYAIVKDDQQKIKALELLVDMLFLKSNELEIFKEIFSKINRLEHTDKEKRKTRSATIADAITTIEYNEPEENSAWGHW